MSEQIKKYQCLEQIVNDLYDYVYEHEDFDFGNIERVFLMNLIKSFNNTEVSELTGLCVRTLRNKKHQYGLFALPKNLKLLLKEAQKGASRPPSRGSDSACSDEGVRE